MTSKPARKKRSNLNPVQAGPHFEALEPRLLLSADPLGGGVGADYLAEKAPSEIDEPGVLEALLDALAPPTAELQPHRYCLNYRPPWTWRPWRA